MAETVYPLQRTSSNAAATAKLAAAFAAQSPHVTLRRTPVPALLIYGAVFLVWLLLSSAAFIAEGPFAWSVGIAYVAYDTLLIGFVATQIATVLRAPPRRSAPADTAARPTVAIIVAAWNEAATLPATIDALLAQDDPADVIIIADDGSTDGMETVFFARSGPRASHSPDEQARSGNVSRFLYLKLPHAGKANALNEALVQATADIVITVDADTILKSDAVGIVRAAFARDARLVVGGGILTPVCPATAAGRSFETFQRYEYIRNFISRFAWSRVNALLLVSGAFAAFRREPLLLVGGFDRASLVEDYEIIHRLQRYSRERALGWRVRILGRARATTGAPASVVGFLRQRRTLVRGLPADAILAPRHDGNADLRRRRPGYAAGESARHAAADLRTDRARPPAGLPVYRQDRACRAGLRHHDGQDLSRFRVLPSVHRHLPPLDR